MRVDDVAAWRHDGLLCARRASGPATTARTSSATPAATATSSTATTRSSPPSTTPTRTVVAGIRCSASRRCAARCRPSWAPHEEASHPRRSGSGSASDQRPLAEAHGPARARRSARRSTERAAAAATCSGGYNDKASKLRRSYGGRRTSRELLDRGRFESAMPAFTGRPRRSSKALLEYLAAELLGREVSDAHAAGRTPGLRLHPRHRSG